MHKETAHGWSFKAPRYLYRTATLLARYIYVFRMTHNELPFFLQLLVCVMMQCEDLAARKLVLSFLVYKNSEFCGKSFRLASVCPEFKSWPGGSCLFPQSL
jgi:hypothetical protein